MTGGPGFGADQGLREGLDDRGLAYRLEAPAEAEPLLGEAVHPADGGRVWLGNASSDGDAAANARQRAPLRTPPPAWYGSWG